MKRDSIIEETVLTSGTDAETVGKVCDAMKLVLTDAALALDSVAIPGFGTFTPVKTDERIEVADGRRMMYPPHISINFRPSVLLRKSLE